MPGEPPFTFQLAFVLLVVLTSAAFVALVWRAFISSGADAARRAMGRAAVGVGVVMLASAIITTFDGLRVWDRLPPPMMAPLLGASILTAVLALRSRAGHTLATSTPLALLLGFQAFRVPVELVLHWAYELGIIGVQMTYSGLNFDIVSGLGGLALGLWAIKAPPPRWLLWTWNIVGLGLLLNIVGVAILSMPTPMRYFMSGPANVWVSYAPYIWLPTVLVQFALGGHLLLFRRLLTTRASE